MGFLRRLERGRRPVATSVPMWITRPPQLEVRCPGSGGHVPALRLGVR